MSENVDVRIVIKDLFASLKAGALIVLIAIILGGGAGFLLGMSQQKKYIASLHLKIGQVGAINSSFWVENSRQEISLIESPNDLAVRVGSAGFMDALNAKVGAELAAEKPTIVPKFEKNSRVVEINLASNNLEFLKKMSDVIKNEILRAHQGLYNEAVEYYKTELNKLSAAKDDESLRWKHQLVNVLSPAVSKMTEVSQAYVGANIVDRFIPRFTTLGIVFGILIGVFIVWLRKYLSGGFRY